jgi:hypothetical protein
MNDNKDFMKVLKWAGIIALIAVPVFMVLKKKQQRDADRTDEDDANIFSAELGE